MTMVALLLLLPATCAVGVMVGRMIGRDIWPAVTGSIFNKRAVW